MDKLPKKIYGDLALGKDRSIGGCEPENSPWINIDAKKLMQLAQEGKLNSIYQELKERQNMNIGDRVGAVASTDKEASKMYLFGYGTYEGSKIPEEENVLIMHLPLKKLNMKNPCILLDSGERVYGCECWWGSEDRIKEMEKTFQTVEIITPEEYRKK